MAAGLGFKTFTTGEVLTAADTNGYLMQGVLVFASSAARASAITSPQEGQYSYLKDTDALEYYSGSAWVGAPVGDITGVTAGTGISGGGTSGTVTVTNSMATEITAAGDIIVGTGSGTFDNLPIGTTAQVLTADTTVSPYKVKWATPASGGGMTLLSTTTLSGTSTTISSISGSYNNLYVVLSGVTTASTATVRFSTNNSSSLMSTYRIDASGITRTLLTSQLDLDDSVQQPVNNATTNIYTFLIENYASTTTFKTFYGFASYNGTSTNGRYFQYAGGIASNTATDSITFTSSAGGITFNAGTAKIYGVK